MSLHTTPSDAGARSHGRGSLDHLGRARSRGPGRMREPGARLLGRAAGHLPGAPDAQTQYQQQQGRGEDQARGTERPRQPRLRREAAHARGHVFRRPDHARPRGAARGVSPSCAADESAAGRGSREAGLARRLLEYHRGPPGPSLKVPGLPSPGPPLPARPVRAAPFGHRLPPGRLWKTAHRPPPPPGQEEGLEKRGKGVRISRARAAEGLREGDFSSELEMSRSGPSSPRPRPATALALEEAWGCARCALAPAPSSAAPPPRPQPAGCPRACAPPSTPRFPARSRACWAPRPVPEAGKTGTRAGPGPSRSPRGTHHPGRETTEETRYCKTTLRYYDRSGTSPAGWP